MTLREEDDNYGFAYNIHENLIFRVDHEAFEYISTLLNLRLDELNKNKKELLERLYISG